MEFLTRAVDEKGQGRGTQATYNKTRTQKSKGDEEHRKARGIKNLHHASVWVTGSPDYLTIGGSQFKQTGKFSHTCRVVCNVRVFQRA